MPTKRIAELAGSLRAGRCFWLLFGLSLLIFLGGLGSREIWSGDETRVAGISAEMALDNNYVLPRLNGQPFLEYPPLYYWCVSGCFRLFGFTDFASQLPSALAAVGGVLVVFALTRRLGYGNLAALLSGLILATSAQYFGNGRTCMVDMLLAFFVILAIWAFREWIDSRGNRKPAWLLLTAAALAGGIMTKGLVGLALPLAAIGSYMVLENSLISRRLRWKWYAGMSLACLLALLPAAAWLAMLHDTAGGSAVHTVFWTNNFGRFSGSQGDHVVPFYYYLEKLPTLFLPWLVLLPFAGYDAIRQLWRRRDEKLLYLFCYLLIPYLLLTLSSSKRQVYLLPLYAGLAVLVGRWLALALTGEFAWTRRKWFERTLFWAFCGLAAGFIVAGIGLALWGNCFSFPLLSALAGFGALRLIKRHLKPAFGCFLVALAAFFSSIDPAIQSPQDQRESLRQLFQSCLKGMAQGEQVYLYQPAERISGAAMFYLNREIPVIREDRTRWPQSGTILLIVRCKGKTLPAGLLASAAEQVFADHYYVFRTPAGDLEHLITQLKELGV